MKPSFNDYLQCTPEAWQDFLDYIEKEKQYLAEREEDARFWVEQMSDEEVEKHRQDIRSMGYDPDEAPFYSAHLQDKEMSDTMTEEYQEQKKKVDFLTWYKDATPEEIIRKPANEYPTTVCVEMIVIRLHDFTEEDLIREHAKWTDFHRYCRTQHNKSIEHWVWRIKENIQSYREDIFMPMLAVEETANIIEAEQQKTPNLSEKEVARMWQRSKESIDKQWNIDMPIPEYIQKEEETKETKKPKRSFWQRLFS